MKADTIVHLFFQMEQKELRQKEEQAEREKAFIKQQATRQMFDRSIQLAKEKRDKAIHEEMVCDMKLLEEEMKSTADEKLAIQQRKVGYRRAACQRSYSFTRYLL